MSNLTQVLLEHGIDAKKETDYSNFIVRVAQAYDSYDSYGTTLQTYPLMHNGFVYISDKCRYFTVSKLIRMR